MSMKKIGIVSLSILGFLGASCAMRENKSAPQPAETQANTQTNNAQENAPASVKAPLFQTVPMQTSDKVPAAQGEVKVSEGNNSGNTTLDVTVKHMAQPDRIADNLNTYVVWELSTEAYSQPHNIGAISVDQDETGHLQTMTPLKNFQVFVTAENSATAARPTGDKLMWTSISK